jgi:hypothetical protein
MVFGDPEGIEAERLGQQRDVPDIVPYLRVRDRRAAVEDASLISLPIPRIYRLDQQTDFEDFRHGAFFTACARSG